MPGSLTSHCIARRVILRAALGLEAGLWLRSPAAIEWVMPLDEYYGSSWFHAAGIYFIHHRRHGFEGFIACDGFDPNFRILRSIVPDPQNSDDEITTDFKVSCCFYIP
jgi:hypothetical protein